MWTPDTLQLARIQFGFTVSFHIIFPAITIGLASYLAVLEGCWLRTRNEVYRTLYHFWSKIFAVNFGMGVVSGLVMAYQFGTNWSYFSAFAGGVTGPLLAYEVLTAFFLEAGFLGVMLFGWNRVGPGLHFLATLMVAAGTLTSMTWILASNSWMHTPQYQPAKVAAMEGHWSNQPGEGMPLILFGWPDMTEQTVRYAVEVPRLSSLILTHSWDGQIKGLSEFPSDDRPNATIIFWTF